MTSTILQDITSKFFKLLKYIYKWSIFARQSKNGVLTLIIWNLIILIGVATLADLINKVNLILNYILTISCVVVLSCTLVLSL